MTPIAITVAILASSLISYTWGNMKGFEENERNEAKAKAFWEEVERKGLK